MIIHCTKKLATKLPDVSETRLQDNNVFDSVCDRSVQGTMRIAKTMDLEGILWDFPNVMELPIYSVSAQLCHRPVRIKGMKESECLWPDRDMKAFIAGIA